jgi:hypothetical protein
LDATHRLAILAGDAHTEQSSRIRAHRPDAPLCAPLIVD